MENDWKEDEETLDGGEIVQGDIKFSYKSYIYSTITAVTGRNKTYKLLRVNLLYVYYIYIYYIRIVY